MGVVNAPPAVCFTAPAAPSFTITGTPSLGTPWGSFWGHFLPRWRSEGSGAPKGARVLKAPNDVRHRNVHVHEAHHVHEARHDACEASSVPCDRDASRRSAGGLYRPEPNLSAGPRLPQAGTEATTAGSRTPLRLQDRLSRRRPSMSGD